MVSGVLLKLCLCGISERVLQVGYSGVFLLSARTAMWSMPVVLTETENENDSAN